MRSTRFGLAGCGERADETAELVSRDQIFRGKRGQGNTPFTVQPTTRIDNHTRLMPTLPKVMTTTTSNMICL